MSCLVWGDACPVHRVESGLGIDTFVFAGDGTRVQTVRYTLETVGSSSGDTTM